jgi:uncharacterized protein (TIGR01777 family)
MKILVSGASGLIGSALLPELRKVGHDVATLVRFRSSQPNKILWVPQTGDLEREKLDRWGGPEVVVHLAGEGIANHRWTEKQKAKIKESRVKATEGLCAALLKTAHPPTAFVCASAIGFYGNRGEEVLTERSEAGSGFLTEVVLEWEKAAARLSEKAIRVVHLRFGVVLSRNGGALQKMLPVFRMGLGGTLGSGDQWMSWIALADAVRVISTVIEGKEFSGAFNVVSPEPVRNKEFTKTLGELLHRPSFFRVTGFALRLVFGKEMAEELFLGGQKVMPERLLKGGFIFAFPRLKEALKYELEPEKGQ